MNAANAGIILQQAGLTHGLQQAEEVAGGPAEPANIELVPRDCDFRIGLFEEFDLLPRIAGTPILFNLGAAYAEGEVERALLANRNWELTGVNPLQAQANVDFNDGWLKLATGAGSGDSLILQPLIEATVKADGVNNITYASRLATLLWDTAKRPHYRTRIKTPTAGASSNNWGFIGGFKLTSAHALTTDADQAYFRWETSGAGTGTLHCVVSVANVDFDADTGIPYKPFTAVRLDLRIDKNRLPWFFHNKRCVWGPQCAASVGGAQAKPPQLAALTTLLPFHGPFTTTTASKFVLTRGVGVWKDSD